MLKIFAPKLVEHIPNHKWVYRNFWGNEKIILRRDVNITSTSGPDDPSFVANMGKAFINKQALYSDRIAALLNKKAPITGTIYKIYDGIHPERSRICGILCSGDLKMTCIQNLAIGENEPLFDIIEPLTKQI